MCLVKVNHALSLRILSVPFPFLFILTIALIVDLYVTSCRGVRSSALTYLFMLYILVMLDIPSRNRFLFFKRDQVGKPFSLKIVALQKTSITRQLRAVLLYPITNPLFCFISHHSIQVSLFRLQTSKNTKQSLLRTILYVQFIYCSDRTLTNSQHHELFIPPDVPISKRGPINYYFRCSVGAYIDTSSISRNFTSVLNLKLLEHRPLENPQRIREMVLRERISYRPREVALADITSTLLFSVTGSVKGKQRAILVHLKILFFSTSNA